VQRYILFPSSAIPKNDGFAEIPKYGDRYRDGYGDRRKVLG
jgi:hypothetical protein